MFHSTTAENFRSWEAFLDAYYEPIRTALCLIPAVGRDQADDLAQSFFLKMYEREILQRPPIITGRFRNWLYAAARHHAIDEWRKRARRPDHGDAFETIEPVAANAGSLDDAPFDADELYALSVLHMTVQRVHKHLHEEGKAEHWMIFQELVLAPIIPGRVAKTRDELLAMFPGQGPVFLDNRVTTVKRVFRRVLPALIPVDPTENLTPEERFDELLSILQASNNSRLWLAFLTSPMPGVEESPSSSLELAAASSVDDPAGAALAPDVLQDELRVLLAFWLELPLHEYLDGLEAAGAVVGAIVRESRTRRPSGRASAAPQLNLRRLISGSDPLGATIPAGELTNVCSMLKLFAKRVHRAQQRDEKQSPSHGPTRRDNSMPMEIAQVVYNLAGALALSRSNARIIGLGDDRYRKNVNWVLSQPWLDASLRPVFVEALCTLSPA
jgi:DNA-directed RNA polymerase specialized sigma24 family protein